MPNFDSSLLHRFSKFNNFLWVRWFLDKNISNFVPPAWKLNNPYYHSAQLQWHWDNISNFCCRCLELCSNWKWKMFFRLVIRKVFISACRLQSLFKMSSKVHSFLKQCLHNLHFIKTRYLSPNLSKLAPADISWHVWWKYHFFVSNIDRATTVLKTNGL